MGTCPKPETLAVGWWAFIPGIPGIIGGIVLRLGIVRLGMVRWACAPGTLLRSTAVTRAHPVRIVYLIWLLLREAVWSETRTWRGGQPPRAIGFARERPHRACRGRGQRRSGAGRQIGSNRARKSIVMGWAPIAPSR